MLDTILIVLKFLALLSAGIWGVVSLRVDYRDKEGKITLWGRRALIGVIASTLVAAITQGIEYYGGQKSSREAAERNYQLLNEISRAVYPLSPAKDMFVSASATIPLTDTSLFKYKKRLLKSGKSMVASGKKTIENGRIWVNKALDIEGKETAGDLHLYHGASLLPDCKNEKIACRALLNFGVEFDLYKIPIDINSYISEKRQDADLHFRAEAEKSSLHVTYSLFDTSIIEIFSDALSINTNRDWRTNTKIASLTDLAGAQMFFYFMDYDTGEDYVDMNYLKIEEHSKINFIQLHIANRLFHISGFKTLKDGKYPVYAYTFPKDLLKADINLR